MRIKTILLAILLLSAPFNSLADEAVELKKKILFDQKRLVIIENMELTEEEGKAFWPVYEKYQEELFQVGQRGAKLLLTYAEAYQTLTDDQAVKIVNEYYDIQDARLATTKKMAEEVGKVLPGKKAFRYLQIESKLKAIAQYELAKKIPLAQ